MRFVISGACGTKRVKDNLSALGCGHLASQTGDAVKLVCVLCSNQQTSNNLVLDETMGDVAQTVVPNL